MFTGIDKDNPVIAWWSGGADSAVTCKLCLEWFGAENVRIVFIDTKNEGKDCKRFKAHCEVWYNKIIETITNPKWDSIWDVWRHYLSLNVATGAICSTELKRIVRQDFQNKNNFSYQAFGFDITETDRAINMKNNYPDSNPIFPVLYQLLKKGESIKVIQNAGIEPPISYQMGFTNANCWDTGCVKGGIGYWQKIQKERTGIFNTMADFEHELTNEKGEPVTICKDQSKGGGLVFLKPHPDYPNMKDISMMKGRMPEPLMECNGFCGPKPHNAKTGGSIISF